jgi:hypothetical protein
LGARGTGEVEELLAKRSGSLWEGGAAEGVKESSLQSIGHESYPSLVARLRATGSRWSRKSSIALAMLVDAMWRGWILAQVRLKERVCGVSDMRVRRSGRGNSRL